jgi:hypothetical protein
MAAVPTHTYALAHIPAADMAAEGVNATGYFMPGNARIFQTRPQAIFDEHVAMANTTCFHLNPNLVFSWLRNVALDQFPFPTRLTNLCNLHALHKHSFQ